MQTSIHYDYDYIVIGSGFGGSVSAMRLAQKGYSVAVLESGKRWRPADFPETNWSIHKFLWMPGLRFFGIQRLNLLNDFFLLSGAGVGGGSLVYGNTLYVPGEALFRTRAFAGMGGKKELLPFYEIALRMLGVTENPVFGPGDRLLQDYADEIGKGKTFRPTPVGVYFGKPGVTQKDPYFGGDGPDRTGCNFCGGCMVGCRFGAKNTLDQNYLYFAEKLGAIVFPETKATELAPLNARGEADPDATGEYGYEIRTKSTTSWTGGPRRRLRAKSVVLSAAVLGTVGLLMKMRESGKMKRLSPQLGERVRTNSETVLAITKYDGSTDFSRGVAITSSIHVDDHTHIEAVKYSEKSDFFGALASVVTDGGGSIPRPLRFFATIIKHPLYFLKASWPFGFAKKSLILLVMQTIDNSIRLVRKRRLVWPFQKSITSALSSGEPTPTYIPAANRAARSIAAKIGGVPRSSLNDVLLNAPITGHIMGGCIMGASAAEGVIDYENRVFGYENLRVCDGSMITENLGVNPSLTITALSERAMSFIPPRSERDITHFKFEKTLGITRTLFQTRRWLAARTAKPVRRRS